MTDGAPLTHFRPLNSRLPFQRWPHFDPGRWIDFNPSFVRLATGQAFAVIRRDKLPPVPGKGTVWAVPVDEHMVPSGRPFPLVADGEDPRAVRVGDRVLVFYVLFERDEAQRITGTSMVLAEFEPGAEHWQARAHFKLPKYPLGGAPAGSNPGWEKNWVPFAISDRQVGLIYSHDPWQVIVLNVDAGTSERRFEQAYRAPGLHWNFGAIRGGTPPVPYAANELITFFHSSEVVGSRKSYMAGACVMQAAPPYAPLRITTQPLLVAPYHGGMHRHGWPVAASVIFPLGCQAVGSADDGSAGFQLLCGIDDGEIASFVVPRADIEERLVPLPLPLVASVQHPDRDALPADKPLLLQPPGAAAPDWPLLRFLAMVAPRGRTLLDIGSDSGLFSAGLALGYEQVHAVALDDHALAWRSRNVALNGLANVTPHRRLEAVLELPGLDLVCIDHADLGSTVALLAPQLARDKPLLLLLGAADHSDRAALAPLLAELGYSMEGIFQRSPRALWCVHPSRREAIAWFV